MIFVPRAAWTAYAAWRSLGEKSIAYLDVEDLHARQSARLRDILRHAWAHVPYYRTWLGSAGAEPGDIRTAADLKKLPLIGKQELQREPGRFADPDYERRDGLTLVSSGTGGVRRAFRYDTRAMVDAFAAGRRQRLALAPFVGHEAGYKEAVLFRDGNTGARVRAFWETRLFTPPGIELRRLRLSPALPFDELLAGLNGFRPDVIRGIGSHVGAFLRWVFERGLPWHKPCAVAYGADAMSDADRRLIEHELGVPVVSTYQAVEALRIGFQCEQRQGFHLNVDQVDVRVVDSSGRDVRPGERGTLVLSNLTNRATVVLNYSLGDMVTRAKGPCPCGRTLPLIESIDGRLTDLIARPGGSVVDSSSIIPPLMGVSGVRQVQVIQEDMLEFSVRVIWAHGEPGNDEELRAAMRGVLGAGIRVQVEPVDRIEMEESGKVKTLISKVRVEGGAP